MRASGYGWPIILATGHAELIEAERDERVAMQAVLNKPYSARWRRRGGCFFRGRGEANRQRVRKDRRQSLGQREGSLVSPVAVALRPSSGKKR
jgi:hypothetical protein